MRVLWFSGRSCVGIVEVDTFYDGIQYYIGSPPEPTTEAQDMQWIADWGAKFPKQIGEILFNGDALRTGEAVPVPKSVEQARALVSVGMFYLDQMEGVDD